MWYQSLYLQTLTIAPDTRSQDMKKLEGAIATANLEQAQWNDKNGKIVGTIRATTTVQRHQTFKIGGAHFRYFPSTEYLVTEAAVPYRGDKL